MAALRVGVLGLGSVFEGPYRKQLELLRLEGRVRTTAVFDVDPDKGAAARDLLGLGPEAVVADESDLIGRDDVDVVLVLTAMSEHGRLARAALEAGKHVLVEKPMATTLEEAADLVRLSRQSKGLLVCAPHIVMSPTYREMHRQVTEGEIGPVLLARARYGWSGPWWGQWFYRQQGGALFDLGVYNLTSLCGFMGPVRRVTAMMGTAIPERVVEGETMRVQADDNAHIVLDFGGSRFASIMTGFTMQKYRSPALELYGSEGTLQLMGDDWAPEGFERWRNKAGIWEVFGETDPTWPWTFGLRHLVDSVERGTPTVSRPEHAYHALDVMLAAMTSAREGRAVEVGSDFPALDYTHLDTLADQHHRVHDPRSGL